MPLVRVCPLDRTVQNGVNVPNAQYWLSSSVKVGTSPAAGLNDGPAFDDGNVNSWQTNSCWSPTLAGNIPTASSPPLPTDLFHSLYFPGNQYGIATVVAVVANGNVLFSSSVTSVGQVVPFNTQVSLKARLRPTKEDTIFKIPYSTSGSYYVGDWWPASTWIEVVNTQIALRFSRVGQ